MTAIKMNGSYDTKQIVLSLVCKCMHLGNMVHLLCELNTRCATCCSNKTFFYIIYKEESSSGRKCDR